VGYYEPLSPTRVAKIKVKDDSGNERILDGTKTQTTNFYDNGGQLKFTSLGILGSNRGCVGGSNVAIVQEEGVWKIYEKNDYDRKIGNLKSISVSFAGLISGLPSIYNFLNTRPDINTQFLSNFDDYDIQSTDKFIGYADIGNVEFTVDADQKYYNSFVYTPPNEVRPKIQSISLPKEVKADSTTSVKVTISNRENSEGNVIIEAEVKKGSITPSSKNVLLGTTKTETFIIKSPNLEYLNEVCFKVCDVSTGSNCDSDCESFDVKVEAEETCGNGICESFESYTTCPDDCEKEVEPEEPILLECKWYQDKIMTTQKDCGALYWRAILPFVDCKVYEVQKCVLAGWIWFLILTPIFLLVIYIIYKIARRELKKLK